MFQYKRNVFQTGLIFIGALAYVNNVPLAPDKVVASPAGKWRASPGHPGTLAMMNQV